MFKRSKKKIISAVIAMASLISATCVSASAADVTPRTSQYYLAEGVGAVDYYITDSASSYTSLIGAAAYSWMYTGYGDNPIYMYQTTNFNASNMDIYAQNDGLQAGYTACTFYVDVRTEGHIIVDPTTSFWDYGEVYLNTYPSLFPALADVTKQGVICHEMGHVFGLAHNNDNINSIMCQLGYGRVVYKPGLADHYGINAMY